VTTVEKTSRSVAWAGLEIVSLLVLSLVTLIFLARLLGPAEFGLAALALVTVQFLTMIVRSVFIDAIVQRERLEPAHLDSAFWAGLLAAVAFIGLCVWGAPWLGRLFGEPALAGVLAWTSVSLAFSGADGVPMAILRRDLRMKELALRSFFGRLAGAVVGIGMALADYGVWALVGQQVAMEAGAALAAFWFTGWRPAGWVSRPHLVELWRFALPWLGGELLMYGNQRFFSLLVGYFYGATTLGYINVGFRTVATIGQVLEVAAHQITLPIFARLQNDREALRAAFDKAAAIASFLVLPAFTGLVVCADTVVPALLGDDWVPSIPFIQLMGIATFLQFLLCLASAIYSAVGRPIWRFWRGGFDLTVTTVGLVAFSGLGAIWAGVVWAGRFLFLVPFNYFGMWRLIGLRLGGHLRALAPSALAAALMAVTLRLVEQRLTADWLPVEALLLLVPVAIVVYLAAFALIARAELREYLDYTRMAATVPSTYRRKVAKVVDDAGVTRPLRHR
jgi:O-antigen/teichoic acid export membrane protein